MTLVKLGAVLPLAVAFSLQCAAQCTNANLNGTLIYSISGTVKSAGSTVSYNELGTVVADGNGNLTSGTTTTSIAGVITPLNVTGNYSIQANCSGTITVNTSANNLQFSIQLVNGGSIAMSSVTTSGNSEVADGRFYRAGNASGVACGPGTLQGTWGVLLSGGTYSGATRTAYESLSQATFNGNGGLTITGELTTPSIVNSTFTYNGTYTMAANCTGTVQLEVPGVGNLNYAIGRESGGTLLLLETDAATTINGSSTSQDFANILPQVAFGGGWYTALYFTNTTSTPISFLVSFFTDKGAPMNVPGVGTTTQVALAPLGTAIIEALNTGSLTEGYATFSLPAGITGYGVFRQSIAGEPDQEGLVGYKDAANTVVDMTFDDTAYTTAVAIVNPSNVAATVTITCWDNNGNKLGSAQVALPVGNKTENTLRAYVPGIAGFRGSAQFSVSTGNVAVLGLRFGPVAFTSIPTSAP